MIKIKTGVFWCYRKYLKSMQNWIIILCTTAVKVIEVLGKLFELITSNFKLSRSKDSECTVIVILSIAFYYFSPLYIVVVSQGVLKILNIRLLTKVIL